MQHVVAAALVSSIHLLGLALGATGAFVRARAFAMNDMKTVLRADAAWGIAALVLLATGLYRFYNLEKGAQFYTHNPFFPAKMTAFTVILALEAWPMITLLRVRLGKHVVAEARMRTFAKITYAQLVFLIVVVAFASLMARGVGQFG